MERISIATRVGVQTIQQAGIFMRENREALVRHQAVHVDNPVTVFF